MEQLKLDISRVFDFISKDEIHQLEGECLQAQDTLYKASGPGNDFLGWLRLPAEITNETLDKIEEAAASLKESSDLLVVVGIGGSYLGARAVNDALAHNFSHLKKTGSIPHDFCRTQYWRRLYA